jgi:hypothetical protein
MDITDGARDEVRRACRNAILWVEHMPYHAIDELQTGIAEGLQDSVVNGSMSERDHRFLAWQYGNMFTALRQSIV